MNETNKIDLTSSTANMFGVLPCPKCKSEFRVPMKKENGQIVIRCDDCNTEEELKE